MKQIILFTASILIGIISFAQTMLKGIIKDKDDKPLQGVTISIKGTQRGTQTNNNGEFSIMASAGDRLVINLMGFTAMDIAVSEQHLKNGVAVTLEASNNNMVDVIVVGGGSLSPKSYWIGAKVGYNFDGFSEDDLDNYFIGAAKVILNRSKNKFVKGEWGVVGNIAGFISNQNKEDASKDLQKLTLSVQGLGVGLYQLWEQKAGQKNAAREYLTAGYRLNTFKKVGKDSITVNLSQAKLTAGFEFEALTFEKGGSLNFSFELSHIQFSKTRYNAVFGEGKSSLTSFEIGTILPINSNFGFFASGTFAAHMVPVYLFGVVVKSDSK